MTEVVVTAEELREVIASALRGLGASEAEATAQADQLTESELRGRPSHGLHRLSVLVDRIHNGLLRPRAEVEATWRAPGVLAVDGGGGFGPFVADLALAQLGERAWETGIALATVRNAGHLGMLAPYVERLADRGLVGIALTTSEALVHPAGGFRPMVGTNPIAVGIPVSPDPPFVLDMSTAAISMGEVIARSHTEEELPPGVAVDSVGNPTTDPRAARDGALSPFGGGKGFGLGLAIELLVASLSGTAFGLDVLGTLDTTHAVSKGDLFIVIDPVSAGAGSNLAAAREYLTALRDSPPAPGSDGVSIPGDRARRERSRRMEAGISVVDSVWRQAQELAAGPARSGAEGE